MVPDGEGGGVPFLFYSFLFFYSLLFFSRQVRISMFVVIFALIKKDEDNREKGEGRSGKRSQIKETIMIINDSRGDRAGRVHKSGTSAQNLQEGNCFLDLNERLDGSKILITKRKEE